ncbi:hypothetical protein GX51_02867 [Blastomyces parvus]|uniref:Uncharacterized protein n=1 Tax=Blastomyces parvus TaxID=2060905 RepID=A0A2B7X9F0_9EURO|nr:hypothetical protein GX51_02867 [Blastomyces parvus]
MSKRAGNENEQQKSNCSSDTGLPVIGHQMGSSRAERTNEQQRAEQSPPTSDCRLEERALLAAWTGANESGQRARKCGFELHALAFLPTTLDAVHTQ